MNARSLRQGPPAAGEAACAADPAAVLQRLGRLLALQGVAADKRAALAHLQGVALEAAGDAAAAAARYREAATLLRAQLASLREDPWRSAQAALRAAERQGTADTLR
ncbi:MAG: hypothetical protein KF863_05615 [Rubrivivax sp.]|nr:hypothetical protein [Rubrivivax sp.]